MRQSQSNESSSNGYRLTKQSSQDMNLDDDDAFDSKLQAKNIIRAFITTENDAQEIKARNLNQKPSYWKQQGSQLQQASSRETNELNIVQNKNNERLMNHLQAIRQPNKSDSNNDLDNDISLALELISRRRAVEGQIKDNESINRSKEIGQISSNESSSNIVMSMEMRQARIRQMKEARLSQAAQDKVKQCQDKIQQLQQQQQQQKEQDKNKVGSYKNNTSCMNSSLRAQSSKMTRNSNSTKKEEDSNKEKDIDNDSIPLKKLNLKNEIQQFKNKRQDLEKHSKKMEEDMKALKENLRREYVVVDPERNNSSISGSSQSNRKETVVKNTKEQKEDNDQIEDQRQIQRENNNNINKTNNSLNNITKSKNASLISNVKSNTGNKYSSLIANDSIVQTMELLEKDADSTRQRYNEFRVNRLVKAFSYVNKRISRQYYGYVWQILQGILRQTQKEHKQILNLQRLRQLNRIFSAWKRYFIDKKDSRDVQNFLQERIYEDSFLNRADQYYQRRMLRGAMKSWKKYWKANKQSKELLKKQSNMKREINGFIQALSQTIESAQNNNKEQLEKEKGILIKRNEKDKNDDSKSRGDSLNSSKRSFNVRSTPQKQDNQGVKQVNMDLQKEEKNMINKNSINKNNKNTDYDNQQKDQSNGILDYGQQQQYDSENGEELERQEEDNLSEGSSHRQDIMYDEVARSQVPLPITASFQGNNRQQQQLLQQQQQPPTFRQSDDRIYQQQEHNDSVGSQGQQNDQDSQIEDSCEQQGQYYEENNDSQELEEREDLDEEINEIEESNNNNNNISKNIQNNKNDVSQQSIASAQKREDKLKELQLRNEARKKKAEEFKKKHEDQRREKQEMLALKEQQENEKARMQRQEEYELFQKKKREEQEKKEQIIREKQAQAERLKLAKEHHLRAIQRYYGLIPWLKLMSETNQKTIRASQFCYAQSLSRGLRWLKQATIISKKDFEREMEVKTNKAERHYKKKVLQKGFEMILTFVDSSREQSRELAIQRKGYIKRLAFNSWNLALASIKEENIQFEEQYTPIISQFRKVVLLLRSFKGWRSVSEEERKERLKQGHKQQMWSKVNTWLNQIPIGEEDNKQDVKNKHNMEFGQNDYGNSSSNGNPGQDNIDFHENNNESNIFFDGDDENYSEINQSQVKREALLKYYSTIQAKNNSSKQSQL